jgi:penicillin-binding protein 1A
MSRIVRSFKRLRRGPRWRRWAVYAGAASLVLAGLAVLGLWVAVARVARDLPDIGWAERYRPPIVSDVLSGDDQLLGEFYNERRRVVPYERIPKKMVQAFIAAEDDRFFDHNGLDLIGIARAAVQNVLAGRKKSGASTLTQQTAKAILISTWGFERATAKTFKRKLCEAILARRLEARFTKEEILSLYLNQVYLGHQSYGVQAAAENYFRKNVWNLTLGEMSLLAGLPQAPSKYSPFRHPERARNRRVYVLGRMLSEGMITQADHDSAVNEEVVVYPVEDVFRETAPFVTEHVRRDIAERYRVTRKRIDPDGTEREVEESRLQSDGLKVYATVDADLEREASNATLKGLLKADKRQGFRGPLMRLEPRSAAKPGSKAYETAFATRVGEFLKLQREKGAAPDQAAKLAPDEVYVGVVKDTTRDTATIAVGDRIEGVLPLSLMRWARKPNSEVNVEYWGGIDSVKSALDRGDVVLVRTATKDERAAAVGKAARPAKGQSAETEPAVVFALEQDPSFVAEGAKAAGAQVLAPLQSALVSLDPKSGYIVAFIGGYDFNKSEFNRAFQACRQPGSSFKPVYYSAALDGQVRLDADPRCRSRLLGDDERKQCYAESCRLREGFENGVFDAERGRCYLTPSTVFFDKPFVSYDESNGVTWKPQNFEEGFKGNVLLRDALVNSMNLPAVRTLEAVGVKEAAAWARRLGITTKLNEDLSIALGSSCVTLWEMTHVYALFNQLGRKVTSTFIRRIVDRDGRVLEDHSSFYDPWTSLHSRLSAGYAALFTEREQVMEPNTAFVVTNLLNQVATRGTAARSNALGRKVAGKTGTTNDAFDAWFMGFTPELVTGVWVGFDSYDMPMGKYETGGHTALPIWMDYVGAALKGHPQTDFPVPEGVSYVVIDPKTGQRSETGVSQPFRAGTEPGSDDAVDPAAHPVPAGDLFRGQEF